jgi:hypothetical protein
MSKTQELYDQTVNEALREIERLARQAFKKDKRLVGCVVAMGSFMFKTRGGEIIDDSDEDEYPATQPFFEFMDEWDDYLKLSGAGRWFKSDGTTLTDW